MDKTECATRILCTILSNEKLAHVLRAQFRERYLRAHPEARQAHAVWRMFLKQADRAAFASADVEERLELFSRGHPEEHAHLKALQSAVEIDAFVDQAAEIAEKLIKRIQ